MGYINHWIPAFAGMTTEAIDLFCQSLTLRSAALTRGPASCAALAVYALPLFLTFYCFSQSCPIVIPAKAGIHAYRDVGGRVASGTRGRGERGRDAGRCTDNARLCQARSTTSPWRAPLQRRRIGTTSAACSRRRSTTSAACSSRGSTTCMQAGLRRNDGKGIPGFSGMTAGRQIYFDNPLPCGLPP